MATTRRVMLVLSLSLAGSAGTAYYILSEGGDEKIARARTDKILAEARTSVDATVARALQKAPTIGIDDGAKDVLSKIEVRPSNPDYPATLPSVSSNHPASSSDERGGRSTYPQRDKSTAVQSIHPAAYAGCHTCSGPRLWFYADKLGGTRLKRRFTPHPDPSSDS